MKKNYILFGSLAVSMMAGAQSFDLTLDIESDYLNSTVVVEESALDVTPLFVGGEDSVLTFDGSDNFTGYASAKQWHDFIGVTEDLANPGEFWITVNHERIEANDLIGDGGGMTVFKAMEDVDGNVTVIDQSMYGQSGKFWNVNFRDFVGETGMNCGGIQAPDGRIWTAEEWFRTSNANISYDGTGVRDTSDWTISTDVAGNLDGEVVSKFENFNYMVEIDPATAKAVRKQYNWGRLGFEGGAISNDMTTVYLGVDANPTFFYKFVANTPGDFTSGNLYVFKASNGQGSRWVQLANTEIEHILNVTDSAIAEGATMYNRLEWVALDTTSGMVYMTETGRDDIGSRWSDELAEGAEYAAHHIARGADAQGEDYADYYGRVLAFNPATEEITVLLEGGADNVLYDDQESVGAKNYPTNHLSNPDGLTFFIMGTTPYLIIQEDLNGTSHNRVPYGVNNRACEVFLLDLTIPNPSTTDLVRIFVGTMGAEVTGARPTPSGKTILLDVQHPNSNEMVNDFPYNNSVTVAITGFEGILTSMAPPTFNKESSFEIFPNPVSRELHLNQVTDVAIYTELGQRVLVQRNTDLVDISGLESGVYVIVNGDDEGQKLIIK